MYIRRVESNLIRSRSVESGFHTTVLEFEVSSSHEVSINDISFLLYIKHGSTEKLWIDEKRWFCAFLPEVPAIRSVYLSTWRTWSSARFDSLSVCIATFNVKYSFKTKQISVRWADYPGSFDSLRMRNFLVSSWSSLLRALPSFGGKMASSSMRPSSITAYHQKVVSRTQESGTL